MPQDISGYDVGALLYCPANAHHTVAQAVAAERLPRPFSLALCLEDTVRADALAAAEQAVEQTLHDLTDAARQETFYRPLTFVRVRSPVPPGRGTAEDTICTMEPAARHSRKSAWMPNALSTNQGIM